MAIRSTLAFLGGVGATLMFAMPQQDELLYRALDSPDSEWVDSSRVSRVYDVADLPLWTNAGRGLARGTWFDPSILVALVSFRATDEAGVLVEVSKPGTLTINATMCDHAGVSALLAQLRRASDVVGDCHYRPYVWSDWHGGHESRGRAQTRYRLTTPLRYGPRWPSQPWPTIDSRLQDSVVHEEDRLPVRGGPTEPRSLNSPDCSVFEEWLSNIHRPTDTEAVEHAPLSSPRRLAADWLRGVADWLEP